MGDYPEHEKMAKIVNESQRIGEFLDWLGEVKHIQLYQNHQYPVRQSTERLLAEFFGIDLDKIETEKRAMLDKIRAQKVEVAKV